MKIQPVKGTNDYLPEEARLRDYLTQTISRVYEDAGFMKIATPIIEDIENLDKSDGGDNLNLIFKIMKRGEKLKKALERGDEEGIADLGLRYDLTLPLSRYYAPNRDRLPAPFKVIQMDRVYRAERPQKGRLREFMQCDIDILGSDSADCEIELIHTTAKALLAVGIKHFKVRINDRRVLREVLLSVGFRESDLDSVCISFDKLNKIGVSGVRDELTGKGMEEETVASFVNLIGDAPLSLSAVRSLVTNREYADGLSRIIEASKALSEGLYTIEYDSTLVRGQGYYTGTVFEVESLDFNSSIAGGGRYDNLIGKFVKGDVPAVGFSIGFERIFSILSEKGGDPFGDRKLVALLYDEGEVVTAIKKAEKLRKDYRTALYVRPKKTGKLLNRLEKQGYSGFMVCDQDEDIRFF